MVFGVEFDVLYLCILVDFGVDDVCYICWVCVVVCVCCWSGRVLLMFGWLLLIWLFGSLFFGLGKIFENMELGYNVMYG